jgi:hypothetical protein
MGKGGDRTGRLVLVVGPSGVGKDSVLDGARAALKGNPDVVFPRRVVTRAPGLGGEDYIPASEADFAAMAANGDFALHWPAHGLHYGIPNSIEADLAAGRQVVVNVSQLSLQVGIGKTTTAPHLPGSLSLIISEGQLHTGASVSFTVILNSHGISVPRSPLLTQTTLVVPTGKKSPGL